MQPAPAGAPAAQVVGKKQLCALLGWSRPTLDSRLDKDPDFPVAKRGGKGGGWEFDPDAVQAYLLGASAARTEGDVDDAGLGGEGDGPADNVQIFPSAGRVQHQGEATASQRHKLAQAQLIEDKLRRARGDLVEAADMRAVLETTLANLRTELLNMPDAIAKELNLGDRLAIVMKRRVEASLRAVVLKVQKELGVDAPGEVSSDV